jgi:hypothetical protein
VLTLYQFKEQKMENVNQKISSDFICADWDVQKQVCILRGGPSSREGFEQEGGRTWRPLG